MSSIAALSKPYWRWRRYRKARGLDRRSGAIAKPWNGLVVMLLLLVVDMATKEGLTTQPWAWHLQPSSWLIYPAIITLLTAPFLLLDETRFGAVMALAGVIGNALSELVYGRVANPFLTQHGNTHVAFNTADVLILTGYALLLFGLTRFLLNARRQA